MNTNRYLIASPVTGVWMVVYGFVANQVVLGDFWSSQVAPGLVRPEGEEILGAVIASCFLQAFALGFIFTRGYEARGLGEGVRFGLLVAWFVASLYLLFYALQPWNVISVTVSALTDGLMYVGAGVVLALLYRKA